MGNIISFLTETKSELLKVIWPSRGEFIGSTVVVLFLVAIFSAFLGIVDFLLTSIAQKIF